MTDAEASPFSAITRCPVCHGPELVHDAGARCASCGAFFPETSGRIDYRHLPERFQDQDEVRIDTDYEPADPTFRDRIYGGPRLAAGHLLQTLVDLHAAQGKFRLLDIGMHLFGNGGFKPYHQKAGEILDLYVAIDPSTWYLPKPGEVHAGCEFFQAFGEYLPVEDDLVDVVISTATFDHLFDPDQCLEEIRRVLVPGGRFIVQLNNDRSWFKRVFKKHAAKVKIESAKEHNNFWTPESMAAQLERHGFEVLETHCYRYNPLVDTARLGKALPYSLHLGLCHLSDTVGRLLMPRLGGNFTLVARTPASS